MDNGGYIFGHPEDCDATFAVSFWTHMMQISIALAPVVYHGGSLPGKAPNLERNYHANHTYYMHKYFWPRDCLRLGTCAYGPQQPEEQF